MQAFAVWCKHAVECLLVLQGADDERIEQSEDGSNSCIVDNIVDNLRVSNRVVDNELGRTNVEVLHS